MANVEKKGKLTHIQNIQESLPISTPAEVIFTRRKIRRHPDANDKRKPKLRLSESKKTSPN